jgi:gliding motility-associated lipoprotein GldH
MLRNVKIITAVSLLLWLAGACTGESLELKAYKEFPGKVWHRTDTVHFTYTANSEGLKNFYIYLENTTDYPYSNIYIIAKMQSGNKIHVDTLEYLMADGHGRWLGRKVRDVYENQLVLGTGIKTARGEKIEWELEPATRNIKNIEGDKALPGIVKIGLVVESIQQKN